MKRLIERFSTDWPSKPPSVFDAKTNLIDIDDLPRILSKSDLERSWREFINWIGFSELVKSVERKEQSIGQTSLRLVAEDMIELFDRLLGHAFRPKRDHISMVIFSSDTRLIDRKAFGHSKLVRAADGKNHKRFYANPSARFPLVRKPDVASQQ
jgi:hypothetical protein